MKIGHEKEKKTLYSSNLMLLKKALLNGTPIHKTIHVKIFI